MDERLRLMDVQPVHNKNPASVRGGLDRLLDVGGKVLFRPRGTKRRRQELPGSDRKIANEGRSIYQHL
jgi:hypothetical protein